MKHKALDQEHQPGGLAAVKAGCLCAVIDNAFGRGYGGSSGEHAYYCITGGCPLHDPVEAARRRVTRGSSTG